MMLRACWLIGLAMVLAACRATPAPSEAPAAVGQEPGPAAPAAVATAPAPTATLTPRVQGAIAFSKGHDIWVYSGGQARQVTTLGSVQNPAWSPDGGELAFDRAGKNSADLWLLPYPRGAARALTNDGSPVVDANFWEMQPSWSPDGASLVYASDRARTRTGTLDLAAWQMTLSTRARSQLTGANRYTGGIDYPSWRPGSATPEVLYTSWTYLPNDPEAYGVLELLQPRTNKAWTLTDSGQTAMQPSWAPNGGRIAFIRRLDGADEVWQAPVPFVVAADADVVAEATPLVHGVNAHPVWSPAGDAIAYIGLRNGSFDLFVQPLTPSFTPVGPPRQLTNGLHVDADSAISWRR